MPAHALYLDGNRQLALGALLAAEACYRQVLEYQPGHVGALANLGVVKERQGELTAAELQYRQALALAPQHAQLQQNLAVLLLNSRRLAECEPLLRQAVALAPDSLAAWNQLGVLLASDRREAEAEACYRHALWLADAGPAAVAAAAEVARTRFNLAYVLLRQGRWQEGWPLLDARWQFDRLPRFADSPRWRGEPLAGKALLIGLEAGQGDMIQFCRYAALARAAGASRIAIVCHPPLKALFTRLRAVDAVYGYDEPVPASGWDYWTLPMSMPAHFATTPDRIPAPVPYLSADPARQAYWAAQLPAGVRRIGLAWRGNPQFDNDAARSLPSLATLAPVITAARRAGITLVSLQHGPAQQEAQQHHGVLPYGAQLQDFADTAALVMQLDLVISIDSAVAHLAGALGRPCWLLLPDYRCDWRWLASGTHTAWYPTLRLWRQHRDGSWAALMAHLAAAIAADNWP